MINEPKVEPTENKKLFTYEYSKNSKPIRNDTEVKSNGMAIVFNAPINKP